MKYEFRGKSVKDAIAKGLKKLNLKAGEVRITILDEGLRGLFSIEGKQQAAVMIEPKPLPSEPPDYAQIQRTLKEHIFEILARIDVIPDAVNTTMLTGRIYANIICRDKKHILGEELICALETVLFEIINGTKASAAGPNALTAGPGMAFDGSARSKVAGDGAAGVSPVKIHLDCNFIIRQKEEALRGEALKLAGEVASDGKTRRWPAGALRFNYRKVVHDAVRETGGVSSRSLGHGDEKIVEIFKS